MKTAIVGSRGFSGYEAMASILSQYQISQVVSGGAKGVDSLAEQWSKENNLPDPIIFLPDWKKYKRAAGFVRNKDIVDAADQVFAFWDGKSQGTLDSIKHAIKTGKPVSVWLVDIEQQTVIRQIS
jgi:hypothetical protein